MVSPYGPFHVDVLDLLPGLLVLAAVGVSLVEQLRRYAWLVSAAGLAVAAGLYLQGDVLPTGAVYPTLAMALALQVGGMLLALGAASARDRWAIVVGIGVGMVAGRYSAGLIIDELRRTVLRASAHSDVLIVGVAAALAVVAGILLVRVAPEAPARSGGRGASRSSGSRWRPSSEPGCWWRGRPCSRTSRSPPPAASASSGPRWSSRSACWPTS
jgi:hypothetical protein